MAVRPVAKSAHCDEVVHGSEASCESANCCIGADNALSKDGVKDSNSANVVECFVQSDQSKGEVSIQSCVRQVTIGKDAMQQKGAQFW